MQTTENSAQPGMPKVVLEQILESYFIDKAPFQIPVHVKEAIVKYVPWINLVLMILLMPLLFFALGIGTFFAPVSFLGGLGSGFTYVISLMLIVATLILQVMALPGLFNRKRSGWVYSYYADLLYVLLNVLSLSIMGIIFNVLFLFVLFQVRSYYK